MNSRSAGLQRAIRALGGYAIGAFAAFVALEGLSSAMLLIYGLSTLDGVSERRHTRYDPELGWVNLSNVSIENMYGPGVSFRTNSQSFRNDGDFSVAAPSGKVRIVCSGDSFTLGYGVSNEEVWCQRLVAIDDRLETINMGQGGYGIDQAYLWYRRDGTRFDHDVLVFAFNTEDFQRMQSDSFEGYGKPLLGLVNGRLVVENAPVPRRAFYAPWLIDALPLARDLRSYRLVSGLLDRLRAGRDSGRRPRRKEARPVLARIFESLRDLNASKGRTLVLVYLPMYGELFRSRAPFREIAREESSRLGLRLFDLTDDFRALEPAQLEEAFIGDPTVRGYGHYSRKGNDFVARRLYERMAGLPELSGRLSAGPGRTEVLPDQGSRIGAAPASRRSKRIR